MSNEATQSSIVLLLSYFPQQNNNEKNGNRKREESYLKIRKGLKMKRNELKMTTSSGYGS